MVNLMHEKTGIGLAANQVGLPYRVFSLRASPENLVCFNPRIVNSSNETTILEEGCLTYPGLWVKIKRPKEVRVRFQLPNGDTRTETFKGLTARAFQHEMDHLNGILFYNRANKYHREIAFKRLKVK
jgi:peptide deformylase